MSADKYLVVIHGTGTLDPSPLQSGVLQTYVPGLRRVVVNLAEAPVDGTATGDHATPPIRAVLALWLGPGGPAEDSEQAADSIAAALGWPVSVYPVREQAQWDGDAPCPLGIRVPGVKRMAFVRRLPGLSVEQFGAHWADVHAPLARHHHPTLVRYTQNVVIGAPSLGASAVDGIAELQFPSAEDYLQRRYDSPAGEAVLRHDVARFLAPRGSRSVWVGEYPLV